MYRGGKERQGERKRELRGRPWVAEDVGPSGPSKGREGSRGKNAKQKRTRRVAAPAVGQSRGRCGERRDAATRAGPGGVGRRDDIWRCRTRGHNGTSPRE